MVYTTDKVKSVKQTDVLSLLGQTLSLTSTPRTASFDLVCTGDESADIYGQRFWSPVHEGEKWV